MAAAGTVELVAREIARALSPLAQHLEATRRDDFFEELGFWLPGGFAPAAEAAGRIALQAGGLPAIVARLSDAIRDDKPVLIVQEGAALLGALQGVLSAISALEPALDAAVTGSGGLTDAQRARLRTEVEQLPKRLLDHSLIAYLEGRSGAVVEALTLIGIIEDLPPTIDPQDPTVLPVRRRILHFDRLLTLFTDPGELLREVFDFGSTAFDGSKLFRVVAEHLIKHGRTFHYTGPPEAPPGTPPTLDLYLARLSVLQGPSGPALSGVLDVLAGEKLTRTVALGPLWTFRLDAEARLSPGVEARLVPPFSVELRPGAPLFLSASAGLKAERADGRPMLLLGQTKGSRLEIGRFAAALGLSAQAGPGGSATVEPSARIEIDGGHLLVDLSSGDGFISTVAGGVKIESAFSLRALWAPSTGLQLQGSGSLDLALPVHLELGPVEITTLYLSAGLREGGALPLEVSGAFTTELGPVKATVDRVGVIATARFRDDGGGNLGPLDLGFAFKPPSGVGLSVDAGVISGGGYLYADPERGEYAGALELEFAGLVELKAIGLISTRLPDKPDGFSLLIVITTEFGTGIQLGYGFTLLAVGGLIGLNRSMNLTALAEGVRTGRVESVMFPDDVVANAPRILSDLRAFFPPEDGTFLIGPMAKIGWGTPALITVSLGVIIEIPGNIAVLGVLTCALPNKELPLLLLQVNFIGAFEFDKSRVWFYAELFDSRILFMTLDGGMGLLVAWGDNPELVLTVGGFHPAFTPPPLPFPVPDRLSIDILNSPGRLIRVSGYFAVTSNNVQFGARAELRLMFAGFGIEGHLAFDALFRFSPFAFVISISAGVSLKAFGVGLFSIDLRFQLEGPSPWRAHGRGSISLLFFEISADFDITWGEEHHTTLPPVEVLPVLEREIGKTEGWQTRLPTGGADPLVTLRTPPGTELVLHPLGTLFVRQRSLPLGVRIDRVGAQRPSDIRRLTVEPHRDSGLVKVSTPDEKFAMAQFQDMDDAAKLSRPAYEDQDAGLELTADKGAFVSVRAVRRSARYELHIIDSRPTGDGSPAALAETPAAPASGPRRFQDVGTAVFRRLLDGSSTSRSPLSQRQARAKQPFAAEDTVQITGQRFVVAHVRNNVQAFAPTAGTTQGTTTFRSRATAEDALADWVEGDPRLAGKLHVIPESDAAGPLPAPGGWTACGPLSGPRADIDPVLLAGGGVLVAGGSASTGAALATTEVFDPVRAVWTPVRNLITARTLHTVTLLPDGRVLVTGGRGADGRPLASAEIHDPVAGTWTAVKSLVTARHSHTATLLPTGAVLVTGGLGARGEGEHALASAKLLNPRAAVPTGPADSTWTATRTPMADARHGHRAVVLRDRRVLVVGGALATGGAPAPLAYCEFYDPDRGVWSAAPTLTTPRAGHEATLLADGSVLVTGGEPTGTPTEGRFPADALTATERFTPATGWEPAAPLPQGRTGHRAVLLRDGRVLVLGGAKSAHGTGYRGALVRDATTGVWSHTGALATGRRSFAAALLADGRVLACGGVERSGPATPDGADVRTAATEIFTP
ncbi:DUF6603 domain-containing protein [Streptomyces sp. NPDC017941]|uniref:DUF6603 domain-containing protein n=1 Tax=Streptomyces sp. NPDC017941 TaxID=3365018 RepID=UPI0037A7A263